MSIDVFISYRGADRVLARKLEQRLRSRWGSRIFRDETSLMAGRSWADQLNHALADAKVMLALIGPGWHVRTEGEDWVRDELLGAIEAGRPVLPVIVGDPDELSQRLTTLPQAFQRQAVRVRGDLAGFDLHQIEKALRDLGALDGPDAEGPGSELSEIIPKLGERRALEALADDRSVAVSGASGSGRAALLRRIVAALAADAARSEAAGDDDGAGETARPGLVAACGIDLRERNRRTHRAVAAWVDGLCDAILGLSPDEQATYGPALVNAVVDHGPDLLARQVLRPGSLLTLGDDNSDERILEAARRPTQVWVPFPPERLVSQSVSVIEHFVATTGLHLTLVVDHVESIDSSSKAVVSRLVSSKPPGVRLVLATSAVRVRAERAHPAHSVARALGMASDTCADFEEVSLHDPDTWQEEGAVIAQWLARHHVHLDDELIRRFDDPNPYYALSALWYLVDNGHLVEERAAGRADAGSGTPRSATELGEGAVTWVLADPDEGLVIPSRDRLLDHKVDEYVPQRYHDLIAIGALIGRRFPFSAAFAVAEAPESIDGEAPTALAIDRWRQAADDAWGSISAIDPDGVVIECHTSADGERMVEFAQVDLVTHLAQRTSRASAVDRHRRLARYFEQPFATDLGATLDDRYTRAKAAATHWAQANEPRHAADAERVAARIAEQALAYREARDHYRRAIRLFTQLLARNTRQAMVSIEDHEDLLILANCLYRLGQMTRLANERREGDGAPNDPTKYFAQALKRLQELSRNLHDKRLAAPGSDDPVGASPRDLPAPNVIRHHIRLCEALSGWINLELAEWYELRGDSSRSRTLLFDTLRHAEAARGESDSRWLLTAASVRLAQQLVDDAVEARPDDPIRAHNLTIEALFQIERVIGLQAVSPDEERNLEDPRSRAWMVLGQVLQAIAGDPRLAEWAFRRMNEHRLDVTDLVDMLTDRQLGLFLLSKARCERSEEESEVVREARRLLERHARWAIESGLDREHAAAYLSLALMELVDRARTGHGDFTRARDYLDRATSHAPDRRMRENAELLRGVLHAVESGESGAAAFEHDDVVAAFREALRVDSGVRDEEVLRRGWTIALGRLLRVCPSLRDELGVDALLDGRRASGLADALTGDRQLMATLAWADEYLTMPHDEHALVPSNDRAIWTMLRLRVAPECFKHAEHAKNVALHLLRTHHPDLDVDSILPILERDVEYAVVVHEWYRSTDPSRLLTLARESNLSIDGGEWASPKLLSGRLALQVLDRQYGAADELGRERYERISAMVANWADGAPDADPLEQLFFVALQMTEPAAGRTAWHALARQRGRLGEAYRAAIDERTQQVRQAGLPIVQDLHLVDADAPPTAPELPTEPAETGTDGPGERPAAAGADEQPLRATATPTANG